MGNIYQDRRLKELEEEESRAPRDPKLDSKLKALEDVKKNLTRPAPPKNDEERERQIRDRLEKRRKILDES